MSLYSQLLTPVRRRIFVSYHHGGDQGYYDSFSNTFSSTFEAVSDNSLDREVDSDDAEYVIRRIRERYITGSSCAVVLCGAETPWRKYVDWEVKATLDKQHGLLAVRLPTAVVRDGRWIVPERVNDNIISGYAVWTTWDLLLLTRPLT